MTTYAFSALSDGQSISFDPSVDVLNFDQTSISAADISVAPDLRPTDLRIAIVVGPSAGKSILLTDTSEVVLASSNITFANGSVALFGDDFPQLANDNAGNVLNGGSGNDLLNGLAGVDTLNGGLGNDAYYLTTGTTGDVLSDSGGIDTVFSSLAYWALGAEFENLALIGNGDIDGDGNAAANVVTGNSGANEFHGNQGNDTIVGNAGNDSIGGGSGNDWLEGGAGNDTLGGSGDRDHFVFREFGAANADSVLDMSSNWDDIQLDIAAFSALGTTGRFASGDARFFAGAGATSGHDASDRVVFNTTTHQLFYDADGSGAGSAQLIATLTNGGNIAATDIFVFGTPGGSVDQTITGTQGPDALTGGAGNDTISGLAGDDTLNGAAGDDSLSSGNGADLLIGGDGNDTLESSGANPEREAAGIDTLQGGAGDDTYIVYSLDVIQDTGGIDLVIPSYEGVYVMPDGIENFRFGFAVNAPDDESVVGNALDNVIRDWDFRGMVRGGAGNDTLFGGDLQLGDAGNDSLVGSDRTETLNGGLGNDTLSGANAVDSFVFDVAPEAANADVVVDFDTGATFDPDRIVLDGAVFTAAGPSGTFAAGDARFFAAAGTSSGHDADDRIVYDTASGRLWYDADGNGSGAAQLIATLQGAPALPASEITVINGHGLVINGTPDDDSLTGSLSADTINGFAGNDTIDGGGAADSMAGGSGNDLYIVDNSSDVIVELPNEGIDEVRASASYTLPDGVENLTLTTETSATGNALDNVMRAESSGFVTLDGLGGNDTLLGGWTVLGGDGDDELRGAGFLDGGAGNDLMVAAASGSQFSGGAGSDTMTGGAGNDTFFQGGGNDGHDVIDGGAGADSFIGGSSAQSAIVVDLAAGTVTGGAAAGAGSATIAGIENVVGTPFADRITGDAGANVLRGDTGDDTMDGGAGVDLLSDSQGADTYVFSSAPGSANADSIVNFASGEDTVRLDASVMPALGVSGRFAAADVRFYAAPGANAGHDGDDRVVFDSSTGQVWYDADGSGAAGAQLIVTLNIEATLAATDIEVVNGAPAVGATEGDDSISGTDGNDTIDALGGNDSVFGHGGDDSILGGEGNDSLVGGGDADYLIGGTGNDTLVGAGADAPLSSLDQVEDTLDGGMGDDTYFVRSDLPIGLQDVIVDDPGGIDSVIAEGSWTLAAGLENLRLVETSSNSARTGIGNELDNVLDGSGNESTELYGMGGNDLLLGGSIQSAGLSGGEGNDTLLGGGHGDGLSGDAGDDVLDGRQGPDVLTGGAGADRFLFTGAPITPNTEGSQITDFTSGVDEIRLDARVMPALGTSGNLAAGDARFFGAAGASSGHDADDRVVYDTSTGNLWYDGDGSGSGAALLITTLGGAPTLLATDIAVDHGTAPPAGPINGTEGDDSLVGTPGVDTMDGGAGNDTYFVTTGDVLTDASGIDTVVSNAPYWLLGTGFENLTLNGTADIDGDGNAAANVITGNSGANEFHGNQGDDTIVGGAGNDSVGGGSGNDWLEGGAGNDTLGGSGDRDHFVFRELGAANADLVTDMSRNWDDIRLDANAFSDLGATGRFAAGDARFFSGAGATAAHDANDRVVYDTSTGNLYYDHDGSGGDAAQLVATLQGAPAILATDIWSFS